MTSHRPLVDALLRWYATAQRDLPWRRTRDPYAIWLSEVMLQQTQVATVIPYWERFLARFPTVESLAETELADVLPFWSGLGYYSRARALHRAAGLMARDHAGQLPRTAVELRELPGFGPYTAGAVASIAFSERTPIVDGNVVRVLSRLFAVEGDPSTKPVRDRLWALAAELVPAGAPGAFNQALMELGALVCTSRQPACLVCPVRSSCQALRLGRVGELPSRKARPMRKVLTWTSAFVERKGEILLARRPESGLFSGLWELPSAEGDATALQALVGPRVALGKPLGRIERVLSHRDLAITVVLGTLRGPAPALPSYLERCWVPGAKVSERGMATAMRACLELALGTATSLLRSSGSARPRRR